MAHIEECRLLYNQLVCARVQAWEKNKESLSRYEQQATLPMLKQQRKSFSLVYSQVLQQVCQRVDWAFKGFFRRLKKKAKTGEKAGFPRYKGQNRYDSITYPQFSNGCRLDDKGLRRKRLVLDSRPSILSTRHKTARHADIERKKHFLIVCIIARRVAIQQTETSMLR